MKTHREKSVYRAELTKLKAFDKVDALITLAITLVMSAGAFYLDGARIAAFGLFPVLGIWQYAQQRGIDRKNTPRLYWTLCLWAIAIFCAASFWALSNPKH